MVNLVKNPEFVRHVRAEMRAPRMLLSGGLSLLLCFLMGEAHSNWIAGQYAGHPLDPLPIPQTLYFWILCLMAVILPLWCLSSCLHAIANERQMKTYDFVRTTRLTAMELMLGYLFGTPIMAYYTVGIAAVVAFVAGLSEHVPVVAMLLTYLMLVVLSIFLSLLGLLVSLIIEKPRAAGLLFVLLFLGWPASALGFAAGNSPFPGIGALGIIPGLLPFYGVQEPSMPSSAPFFGITVPLVLLSLLLYATLGAWVVLALRNNLKKEREEIRLFTNRQALGFSVYMNVLLVGFFSLHAGSYTLQWQYQFMQAATEFLGLNMLAFYVTGLLTLTPGERLRSWYREFKAGRQSYLSNNGLPWPWIAISGCIAYAGFLAISLMANGAESPKVTFGEAAFAIVMLLAFAIRDILFLQWCMLTRMKNPVGKGIGLLWLYYFAVFLLSSVWYGHGVRDVIPAGLAILTPAAAFGEVKIMGDAVFGCALQLLLAGALLVLIGGLLAAHPKAAAAAA